MTITLTDKQAHVVIRALDTFLRLGLGQIHSSVRERAKTKLARLGHSGALC